MITKRIGHTLRSSAIALCATAAAVSAGEPDWHGGPKPCGANGSTISVTVKDKATGQPLAGAKVKLIGFGSPYVRITTFSGTVDFIGLDNQTYQIVISHEGYDTKRRRATTTACGGYIMKRAALEPSSP